MAAGVYNFKCEQGATFRRVLVLTDSNDDPIDLTGFAARMQIRKDVRATATLLELSTANGRITLGGPSGEIELHITATETDDLPRGGVYDLELISDDDVTRVLKGKFELDQEVTR